MYVTSLPDRADTQSFKTVVNEYKSCVMESLTRSARNVNALCMLAYHCIKQILPQFGRWKTFHSKILIMHTKFTALITLELLSNFSGEKKTMQSVGHTLKLFYSSQTKELYMCRSTSHADCLLPMWRNWLTLKTYTEEYELLIVEQLADWQSNQNILTSSLSLSFSLSAPLASRPNGDHHCIAAPPEKPLDHASSRKILNDCWNNKRLLI